MNASVALQHLRNRSLEHIGNKLKELNEFVHPYEKSQIEKQYALDNPLAMHEQAIEIQRVLKSSEVEEFAGIASLNEMGIDALQEQVAVLIHLKNQVLNTEIEAKCIRLYMQSIVQSLILKVCLMSSKSWDDVRRFMLELVVHTHRSGRQVAFLLMFNISVQLYKNEVKSEQNMHSLQHALFGLLVDMIEKWIDVEQVHRKKVQGINDTWEYAIRCLFYFMDCQGTINAERLLALDPPLLQTLIHHAEHLSGDEEYRLTEYLVFSMYLRQACEILENKCMEPAMESPKIEKSRRKSVLPALGNQMSCVAVKKFREVASALRLKFPVSKDEKPIFNMTLDIIRSHGGIDALLNHMYSTTSLRIQRLIAMTIVDAAVDQYNRQNIVHLDHSAVDQVVQLLNANDFAYYLCTTPFILFRNTVEALATSMWKKSKTSNENLSRENFINTLDQVRILSKCEEYYSESSSLKTMIGITQQQTCLENGSVPNAIVQKIIQMLQGTASEEIVKAERWMAELLTFGSHGNQEEDSVAHNGLSQSNNLESKAILMDDDAQELRSVAREHFWDLGRSDNPRLRLSFTKVLIQYCRRRRSTERRAILELLQEIDTCLHMFVTADESDVLVLESLFLLVLEICTRPCGYFQAKVLIKNNAASTVRFYDPTSLHESDSLVALILNGEASINAKLLALVQPTFMVHILCQLSSSLHPEGECVTTCCGITRGRIGDILTCAAFITKSICSDLSIFSALGGIDAFTPFLECCDTRVAIFISSLILDRIRESNLEQYQAALCDMLVSSQATGNERELINPFLQCRTIFSSYWREESGNTV